MVLASLALLILLRLLYTIPYAGWVFKLIAICIAFGSLYNAFKERRAEGGFSF
jgi:1,4-dihydroxy-2-naphthoate octaprenyltransferase